MKKFLLVFFLIVGSLLIGESVLANTYSADISFKISKTVYKTNETIELKGKLYLANFSDDGSLIANFTALADAPVNVLIINKNTSAVLSSYALNTTTNGEFYSKSSFYPNAIPVLAPTSRGYYDIKATYTDPNGVNWSTENEIYVVDEEIDLLKVYMDKFSYDSGESMTITAEAIRIINDQITYLSGVLVNGTIRNSDDTILFSFSCTTGGGGTCKATTTAPSSYGYYSVELNNFKAFSSFEVVPFTVNIQMKDELGETTKHVFSTNEQASVEVWVNTNSTSEVYTFSGIIKNSAGATVKQIDSTTLNSNNSYINRFTFPLDAINFIVGVYYVYVNVTQTGGGVVGASTSFEVRDWDLRIEKKEVGSNFEYGYSAFPGRTVNLEIYPTFRSNGSTIAGINTTTSINISLKDKMNNLIASANSSWNSSCGKEGCYEFPLSLPSTAGEYLLYVTVSYGGAVRTASQLVYVISAVISSQSTDKDGTLKELFGTNEFVYITLSAKNSTSDINLTSAAVVSVRYMNGSDLTYSQVNSFDDVNSSNDLSEWAWNSTMQRLKLDTPKVGGIYDIFITAENNTAATTSRFIINPYGICLVAKNTPGQVGSGMAGGGSYYYVYQFKTSDTVYFELKITQANNPTGKASFESGTNASYGMGSGCSVDTTRKQVVNNANITILEVVNTQTRKVYELNSTESICKGDDEQGGYTCTIKPTTNWDGGSYLVKFLVVGEDGQTSDLAYGSFEARAFYIYGWSSTWQNKPIGNITLNVYMYEAGTNWWGNYGSGGLSGTVKVEKIEYQGRDGEWLWPPISYSYNTSQLNTSTITNGQGSLTLPASYAPGGSWKTGYYRAILKGTDNAGNSDYGYAWFGVKQWEVWASPVECTGSSCSSVWNLNSKSNVSLYVTINNAGEWGQSGRNLGGNVTIRVKKIMDCRKWPCADFNSSKYNSTSITVNTSSGWYWGTVDTRYIINLTPATGSWGTGYWQVVLDVNGTETGSGWFNTIAFYVETQPTDVTGSQWKYNIRNNQPAYFKVTTVKSQKSGWYYGSYNTSDYLNTTIAGAILRTWDQITQQSIEKNYPGDFNITIIGGGSTINGTRILNFTYSNGSWPSGYYWGELTLKNLENETATGWLWFNVQPFRVQSSSNQYSIDSDACVNGTVSIYDPDWYSNTVLNGTYNITSVTERVWSGYGSSLTIYTNYTPTSSFNGNTSFNICPNNGSWGGGSWGGYHYLTMRVCDNESNCQDGWLSFRAIPFQISWGSIVGGTNIQLTSNITVPVILSKSSGGSALGNLSRIYQWRWDNWQSRREEYNFTIGSCNGGSSGSCQVNGTQNVSIIAPSGGWKEGYNYLQAEWLDSSGNRVDDWSGIWFNALAVYTGWWSNVDESGNWKYYFGLSDNLTIRLEVRDSSYNQAVVNVTKVEYSTPSTTCWDDSCRSYNTTTYSIVGSSTNQISGSGIIKIIKPAANWSKGSIYIRATVSGANGTVTIKNGNIYVKDLTAPNITITSPATGQTINTSTFWANWTTSESASCWVYLVNFGNFNSWYCQNSWYNISSQPYCNSSVYSGDSYYYENVGRDYRSWGNGSNWGWSQGSTGLNTGGTSHYYQFSTSGISNQDYGIQIYCNDEDWNYAYGWTVVRINVSSNQSQNTTPQNRTNVTLVYPANGSSINLSSVVLNYTLSGPSYANCSLYGNATGNWSAAQTSSSLTPGSHNFSANWINGSYLWNVYCFDVSNASNFDWGDQNWTFTNNYTGGG